MGQDNRQNNDGYKVWKSIGFFSGEEHLSFIFKKLEKISAALYLVSGLLKDNEPIKWELRERGITILLSSLVLNNLEPLDKNTAVQSLFSTSLEIISLLNLALLSGIISPMNHGILKNELESTIELLREKVFEQTAKAGYILSDTFFKTDTISTAQESKFKSIIEPQSGKSFKVGSVESSRTESDSKANTQSSNSIKAPHINTPIKDKKNDRRDSIIALLQKKSDLTIKDFTEQISNCSAKTIQRELTNLIEEGVVKKEGERRWSRYSLA